MSWAQEISSENLNLWRQSLFPSIILSGIFPVSIQCSWWCCDQAEAGCLRNDGLIPGRDKRFSSFPTLQNGFGSTQAAIALAFSRGSRVVGL